MKLLFNNKLISAVQILITTISANQVIAQQTSFGNMNIFGAAKISFFGPHTMSPGTSGTQPGIIGTPRRIEFGVVNFMVPLPNKSKVSDASYVDGYARKYDDGIFVFPVGDRGRYRPFILEINTTDRTELVSSLGAYFAADPETAITDDIAGQNESVPLPMGGPFSRANKSADVAEVSSKEYWDVDSRFPSKLTLTWNATSELSGLLGRNLSDLMIVGWDPQKKEWVPIAAEVDEVSKLDGQSQSTLTSGTITTTDLIIPNDYQAYTFARKGAPLPVELVSFDATKEANTGSLKWITTEETNADRFDIQRSDDGKSWGHLGSVKAVGESKSPVSYTFHDDSPLTGDNYYRLKMIDRDGTFSYSRIRSLNFPELGHYKVYPNPVSDILKIEVNKNSRIAGVTISNPSGVVVFHSAQTDGNSINVSKLPTGLYLMKVDYEGGAQIKHKVLIKR